MGIRFISISSPGWVGAAARSRGTILPPPPGCWDNIFTPNRAREFDTWMSVWVGGAREEGGVGWLKVLLGFWHWFQLVSLGGVVHLMNSFVEALNLNIFLNKMLQSYFWIIRLCLTCWIMAMLRCDKYCENVFMILVPQKCVLSSNR